MLWISLICSISYKSNWLLWNCQIIFNLQSTFSLFFPYKYKEPLSKVWCLCFFKSSNFVGWLKCNIDRKGCTGTWHFTFRREWTWHCLIWRAKSDTNWRSEMCRLFFLPYAERPSRRFFNLFNISRSRRISLERGIAGALNVIFFCT